MSDDRFYDAICGRVASSKLIKEQVQVQVHTHTHNFIHHQYSKNLKKNKEKSSKIKHCKVTQAQQHSTIQY